MSQDARDVVARTLKQTAEQLPSRMLAQIEKAAMAPDEALKATAFVDEVVDAFDELATAIEQGRLVVMPREAMF